MKRQFLAAIAASVLLSNTSWAQLDLGGAISGAINGATGNAQLTPPQPPGGVPPKAAVNGGLGGAINGAINGAVNGNNPNANGNAATAANVNGGVNQGTGQGWLGRAGSDIRGALQQGDNGTLRLQNNLNPTLQQYGFRPGDQLLDASGQPLTQAQFDQYLQANPGQMRVLRNGQTVVLNGNVQSNLQGNVAGGGMQSGLQTSGRQRLGITMAQAGENVVVSGVTVGSPAAQAGIRPGDQIISVNGQPVANPNAMIQLVGNASANQALDVQYRRNGQVMQSQVNLAGNMNAQNGVYQAGYPQGAGQRAGVQANADVNARIDKLERMVQELRDQLQKMNASGTNEQPADAAK